MRAPADLERRAAALLLAGLLALGAAACSDDGGTSSTMTRRDASTSSQAPRPDDAHASRSPALDELVRCLGEDGGPKIHADAGAARIRALLAALAQSQGDGEIGACLNQARDALERGTAGWSSGTSPGQPRSPDVPVFEGDFADPFLLADGTRYIAYATNTPLANIPVGTGRAGQVSRLDGDALPTLPSWTKPGRVWAPAVARIADGYRLYYSTLEPRSGRQCISVARSDTPTGPFRDRSTRPLVCQLELGGSIDPSPIQVGGRTYLVWKGDGNCCHQPTTIWVSALDADGTRLTGKPTALLGADQPWEGDLVEGPAMLEHDGQLFLFYSANRWDTDGYATGYATCETVLGPCTKVDGPWLASTAAFAGPGGATPVRTSVGVTLLAFHAWTPGKVGYDHGGDRHLYVQPLVFPDGKPLTISPVSS